MLKSYAGLCAGLVCGFLQLTLPALFARAIEANGIFCWQMDDDFFFIPAPLNRFSTQPILGYFSNSDLELYFSTYPLSVIPNGYHPFFNVNVLLN